MTPFASALVAPILHPEPPSIALVELEELRSELRALLPPWRAKLIRSCKDDDAAARLESLIEAIDALVGSSR